MALDTATAGRNINAQALGLRGGVNMAAVPGRRTSGSRLLRNATIRTVDAAAVAA